MTSSYLIYHPARQVTNIENMRVYHDTFGGNEDPYLWNNNFLHTFCHITQFPNEVGQINFWVSGDAYPNFTQMFCDCVFVVFSKHFWTKNDFISASDPIVDNVQCFEHHYKWANLPYNHHSLKRRRRYTLKADGEKSFQPQDQLKELIDILPFLNQNGLPTDRLIREMTSKRGSRPFKLENDLGVRLYEYLLRVAKIQLKGKRLANQHPNWQNGLTLPVQDEALI